MEQKVIRYEIQLQDLRRACAMKDSLIYTHEQEIQKQARQIKYLQNIIKNMPVIAFPCVQKLNTYIDENPIDDRKEKTETEDGWILTEEKEMEGGK